MRSLTSDLRRASYWSPRFNTRYPATRKVWNLMSTLDQSTGAWAHARIYSTLRTKHYLIHPEPQR